MIDCFQSDLFHLQPSIPSCRVRSFFQSDLRHSRPDEMKFGGAGARYWCLIQVFQCSLYSLQTPEQYFDMSVFVCAGWAASPRRPRWLGAGTDRTRSWSSPPLPSTSCWPGPGSSSPTSRPPSKGKLGFRCHFCFTSSF